MQKSRIQKGPAGGTKQAADVKGKLVQFLWELKKEGLKDSTINLYNRHLLTLVKRGADLMDPESIKDVIARQQWDDNTKKLIISTYSRFLQIQGGSWNPPKYRWNRKLPFIPRESEIDQLIAGCAKRTATFLQLLKETGMRSGEAHGIEWTDVDAIGRTIMLKKAEKGGDPRMFKVSSKLIDMLNTLPRKSLKVFGEGKLATWRRSFLRTRKRIAKKVGNPRLVRIHFHTLRHWKATMEYHKTKDILYVKQLLGHKKIETTLCYVQIAEAIFKDTTDDFTVKVASKPDEIKKLLEVGFEYVCDKDGLMFFRKRK